MSSGRDEEFGASLESLPGIMRSRVLGVGSWLLSATGLARCSLRKRFQRSPRERLYARPTPISIRSSPIRNTRSYSLFQPSAIPGTNDPQSVRDAEARVRLHFVERHVLRLVDTRAPAEHPDKQQTGLLPPHIALLCYSDGRGQHRPLYPKCQTISSN